jgi:hypothetical protein
MSFLDSIKDAGSKLVHTGENAIDKAKTAGSAVVDKAEDIGSDVFRGAEKVGSAVVRGAEAAEHAAVKAIKFEASVIRFGIEKSFDGAKKVAVTAARVTVDGVDIATHPGLSNPPASQGLKFSETKSACDLAYKGNKGDVYRFPDGKQWKVVDVNDDPKTGFRGVALKPVDPSDKRVIVAYAGTSGSLTGPDWQTDLKQAAGLSTEQYKQAVDFANKWKAVAGNNVILTGHSLGGGLASYASIKTGLHATAVNSAPLALNHLSLNPAAYTRITQYYVPGEALSVENEINPADVRPGYQLPVRGKDSILDPRSIGSNHSLDHVAPSIPAPQKVS